MKEKGGAGERRGRMRRGVSDGGEGKKGVVGEGSRKWWEEGGVRGKGRGKWERRRSEGKRGPEGWRIGSEEVEGRGEDVG